jgi:putative RNA 2'-phosphotransferase
MKNENDISKFLCFILRHKPDAINITLDDYGYAEIKELIENINKTEYKLSFEQLKDIVYSDNKNRYSFNENLTKIRANQGHSIKNLILDLEEFIPLDVLYHGTSSKFIKNILEEGLLKKQRHHVHLTDDINIAKSVGDRRLKEGNETIILEIDTKTMNTDNIKFYKSTNNIWLVDNV